MTFLIKIHLFVVLESLCSFKTSSTSSSDKTDLHTWRSASRHGRWVTNVLMVTTTVWMLYRVHCNTSNLWPAVTLDLEFVVRRTCLQERLLCTSASCNLSNHSTARIWNELLRSGWELYTCESCVWVLRHNQSVCS